ncbi:hypothetical protein L6P73_27225, partial [Klebsiella pneumoniae]|nr:hypothetical protein [Klebsiella pneumoniae]MCL3077980.1 hypothetical protein [Klebsiella pneumoniae]MCL3083410.1 hypothetical protein [Klebsiella pneumoniae]
AEQEGQQTETEATGAPQKHHYTLNQQVGSITYDICLKYGFDSQQTFTRVFTRTFNQPPGAYRKENHSRAH